MVTAKVRASSTFPQRAIIFGRRPTGLSISGCGMRVASIIEGGKFLAAQTQCHESLNFWQPTQNAL
jgi:hypothetical protein